jgi:hypothetical protein
MKTKMNFHNWGVVLVGLLLLTVHQSTAQERYEAGFSFGTMQYEGEVGGRFYSKLGDLTNKTSTPRMAMSGNVAFHYNDFLTFRSSITIGAVQAADQLLSPGVSPKLDYKISRNLSFRSSIAEFGLAAEFYPMPILQNGYIKEPGKLNPYLVVGFSGFLYNPKSKYTSTMGETYWVKLKPLRTEGQGMGLPDSSPEYKLTSTSIMFGAGARLDISRKHALSFEWINRRTNTDYIDDASGKYIDNSEFDRFFGAGTLQADQAKQKANYPAYINGVHIPGFLPGEQRGSVTKFNDYYYTILIKFHYYFDAKKLIGDISHGTRSALDCYKKF